MPNILVQLDGRTYSMHDFQTTKMDEITHTLEGDKCVSTKYYN
jgi:hypothetical protein